MSWPGLERGMSEIQVYAVTRYITLFRLHIFIFFVARKHSVHDISVLVFGLVKTQQWTFVDGHVTNYKGINYINILNLYTKRFF
jgi:hypothetical protein